MDAQIRSGAVIQDLFVCYYKAGTTFLKWGVNNIIGFDQRKASLNTNDGKKEENSTLYLFIILKKPELGQYMYSDRHSRMDFYT